MDKKINLDTPVYVERRKLFERKIVNIFLSNYICVLGS